MRTLLANLFLAISVSSSLAQGTITWQTPSSPITTNGLGNSGPISGNNTYKFGLYMAPGANQPADSLALVAPFIYNNSAVPGAYTNVTMVLPAPFAVGNTITFQVRAWSSFAGNTYSAALTYAQNGTLPIAFLGQSPTANYTIPSFPAGPPLQPTAFVLSPIPEPSSLALSALGLVILARVWRRRHGA